MRLSNPLLALALVSCGGTVVEPTDVRARITTDLGNVLHASKAAHDVTANTLPGKMLLGYLPALPKLSTLAAFEPDPDAAVAWLTDQLFTDAHYLGDGVYRFSAELACSATDIDCVTRFDAAEVRIRVEDDDGLRFWLQVGPGHLEPIEITLRHTELAVSVDLDEASQVIGSLAPAFGVSTDGATLAGAVTADLTVLGPADARATLSFDRPIAVALQGSRFTSEAGTVATLELADTARADLAFGATTVHTASTNQDLALAAIVASATLDHGVLALDQVSLGDRAATVSVGGAVGEAIDLNPHDGHSFSATVTDTETASSIEVARRFELAITTDHGVLGDEPPLYDVTDIELDGLLQIEPDKLDVISGSLAVVTNPVTYGFAATTGQCVAVNDASEHLVAACHL